MITNLQINPDLLEGAQKLGGFRTEQETIEHALNEFIKRRKRLQLLELQNQIEYLSDHNYKEDRRR